MCNGSSGTNAKKRSRSAWRAACVILASAMSAALFALSACGAGGGEGNGSGTVDSTPIAKVGDMTLTATDYSYALYLTHANVSSVAAQGVSYTEEQAREDALTQAADLIILNAMASEQGISLTDGERAQMLSEISDTSGQTMSMAYAAAQNGMTLEDFSQFAYGMPLEVFEGYYEKGRIASKLVESMASAITLSDEDAKALYAASPEAYNSASLYHVMFLYEGLDSENPRTREESLELAEATLERAQAGDDIMTLAYELSEDTAAMSNYGFYQFYQNDSFDQSLLNWAFGVAGVGDTGIVETAYGYHVVKLQSRNDTFDAVKADLIGEYQYSQALTQYDQQKADPKYAIEVDQAAYDAAYDRIIEVIHQTGANLADASAGEG